MRRMLVVVVLIVVSLVSAGTLSLGEVAAQGGTGEPVAGWLPVGTWDMDQLGELFGTQVGMGPQLSPNGLRLAWVAGSDGLCVGEIADWSVTCFAFPERFRAFDLYWSPDSRMIVTHEDALKRFLESDIWLLNTETGAFSNLTDDGAAGNVMESEDAPLDITPVWDPTTGDLYFFRSLRSGETVNALYRLAADENGIPAGEPEQVVDLTETFSMPFPVYNSTGTFLLNGSAVIAPDGSQMAIIGYVDTRVDGAFIKLIDLADGTLTDLARWTDIRSVGMPDWQSPMGDPPGGLAWSPDGATLYVVNVGIDPPIVVRALDVASGVVTPLVELSGAATREEFMTAEGRYGAVWQYDQMRYPVLLPDGSAMLYHSFANAGVSGQAFGYSAVALPVSEDTQPVRVLEGIEPSSRGMNLMQSSAGMQDDSLHVWIAGRLIAFERSS